MTTYTYLGNNWSGKIDIENVTYSLLCTPCAYGRNVARVQDMSGEPSPSCWQPCILYTLSGLIGAAGGTSFGLLINAEQQVIQGIATICALTYRGLFTGRYRTYMRHKYGLLETPCDDVLFHCLCNQCAIIQETAHINHIVATNILDAPKIESMKK